MKHRANPRFWSFYDQLEPEIRQLADKNFKLLLRDPHHPSLRFKRVGRFWSARVGLNHRAVATRGTTTSSGSGSAAMPNTIACWADPAIDHPGT